MPLADHVLLGADYRRGRDDGHAYAAAPAAPTWAEVRRQIATPETPHPDDALLWDLLVRGPLRESAEDFAALAEMREHLPRLARRAYREGFDQGVRDWLAERVERQLKPPKRWASVLRQSSRLELEAMRFVLPGSRSWTEFFTRSLALTHR